MSLVEFNWEPTDRQLRQFGIISAVALPFIGWIWALPTNAICLLALAGVLIAFAGWLRPRLVKPCFIALAVVATPIGMVLGELLMFLIYSFVFVPMGLWFRLIRRDALQRNCQPRDSYWQPVRQPKDVASYYRQS